jgi:hypothetical protein
VIHLATQVQFGSIEEGVVNADGKGGEEFGDIVSCSISPFQGVAMFVGEV